MSDLHQNLQGKAPYAESSLRQANSQQSKEGDFQPHLSTPANPTALASNAANPWIFPSHSPPDPSKQDMLSDRDAREVSPPGAPVIKQEELTPPQRMTWFQESSPNEGSISSHSTVQVPPHRHATINQADHRNRFLSLYSDTTSEGMSADQDGMHDRQRELFKTLERLCTHTGRYYSRSEHDQRWSPGGRTNHFPFCRHHPYARPITHPSRNRTPQSYQPQTSTTLLDYISCISTTLWSTAFTSPTSSHFAKQQAVQRMANLYSWADNVVSEASSQRVLTEEEVFGVVMSARDLASWCLCEMEKAEIERLWAWWVGMREEGEVF
ncbi:MAG: hypothetical protein M1836_007228 [Candelina mexicana]|nr:MAG: hypothetical protein M1836_007228 [Candelina mexicana]